ncbi:MAG TPA: SDR family NAD(P)-dependent oxidoreductase [Solirubrobacteraceae bacterium]|jgi:NAD(P)-dependent dehydrogenase (short-subunit alcohol dehydrogenase family)|nr:SDR family NAD(P)-dependent oxidoreductase [Solirubrobacteraceae bacterium]
MSGRLDGKSVLITGAARGIGRATAELFAAEGARLVVNDIDEERLRALASELADAGAEVVGMVADVAQEADVEHLVDAATAAFGGLDVAVANAGIIPLQTIDVATVEDWEQVMAIDARGMFLTCKHAIRAMSADGGGGSIVCLSSISGLAGQSGQATYGPAKFVATGLTKHLAVEWAAKGIRVNAVAPGTILTDRVRELEHEPGGPEYLEAISAQHPIGRLGEPSEVARAILFLASDEASFITGAVLPVDGGYLAR